MLTLRLSLAFGRRCLAKCIWLGHGELKFPFFHLCIHVQELTVWSIIVKPGNSIYMTLLLASISSLARITSIHPVACDNTIGEN